MRFSLIVATLGRTDELSRLFASLRDQSYRDFTVVLVDQNADDRVERVVGSAGQELAIRHVHSERGLSRARNVGLRFADGDILAFPDDDCWYSPDLLGRVVEIFQRDPTLDGVAGRCVDAGGKSSGRFDGEAGAIDRFTVWRRCVSAAIFLRSHVVRTVGPFDERLGVGADSPFQSGEETDYILRASARGFRLLYLPDISVYHDQFAGKLDARSRARARSYSKGMGYVLRKHGYPFWFVAYTWFRSLGGVILALATLNVPRSRRHLNKLAGKVVGWLPDRN